MNQDSKLAPNKIALAAQKIKKKEKKRSLALTKLFSFVTIFVMFSSISCKFMVLLMLVTSVISVIAVVRSVRSFIFFIFVISVTSSMIMVSMGVSTIFSTKSVCDRSFTIFHVFVLASNIWCGRGKKKCIEKRRE